MSDERRDHRLDQLIAALSSAQPRLDDLTRARVAASLAESVRQPLRPADGAATAVEFSARGKAIRTSRLARHPGWWIGGVTATAIAVGIAVGFAWRGGEAAAVASSNPRMLAGTHDNRALPADDPSTTPADMREREQRLSELRGAMLPELRERELHSVGPRSTMRGNVAGATFLLSGPGWAKRLEGRLFVDAATLFVERTARGEDAPVELEMFAATIRVQSAAFSVDSGPAFRVTVMRGEIWLRCADAEHERTVASGESATCNRRDADVRPPQEIAKIVPTSSVAMQAAAPPSPPPPAVLSSRSSRSTVATPDAPHGHEPPAVPAGVPPPSPPVPHDAVQSPDVAGTPAPVLAPGAAGGAPANPSSPARMTPMAQVAQMAKLPTIEPGTAREPVVAITAAELAAHYARAERSMPVNRARARAELSALIARAPLTPEAADALLDLALLAIKAKDRAVARVALGRLAMHPAAVNLAMPAARARCDIEVEPAAFRACLAAFRATFPGSPIDADALAQLAAAVASSGNCQDALPLLAEYQRRYPRGPAAATLGNWRARCVP